MKRTAYASGKAPTARVDEKAAQRRREQGLPASLPSWASASDPATGAVYLAWTTDTSEGSRVAMSRSVDAGHSWDGAVEPLGRGKSTGRGERTGA